MRALLAAGAICLAAVPASALAQSRAPVPVELEATWQHKHTSLSVPPEISGFKRTEIIDASENEYDVAIKFENPQTGSFATLYIYRTGVMSVPLWAERTANLILGNDRLGTVDMDNVIHRSFTPANGSGDNSGALVVAPLDGEGLTATALALFAHDDWLVKIRISSGTDDRDALAAKTEVFASMLSLGTSDTGYPPYVRIGDCDKPIAFGRKAKAIQPDMMGSIMLGTILSARDEAVEDKQPDFPTYCRDAWSTSNYSLYRANRDMTGYVVPLNDAGVALSVGRISANWLLKPARQYLVTISNGIIEETLPTFTKLPAPEQAIAASRNMAVIHSRDTRPDGGGGTTIMVLPEE